jgi:hypothetical protein
MCRGAFLLRGQPLHSPPPGSFIATAVDQAVDSSAFLAGCRFMNLFVTRNPVPQSLPGDLGPLVELRTTDPELQLIVPAMHFAEHAHMKL